MAVLYNDRSVLENHHASMTSQVLLLKECNIIGGLTPEERKEFRRIVLSAILHTDMVNHRELLNTMTKRVSLPIGLNTGL
jgi:hypothetical protein